MEQVKRFYGKNQKFIENIVFPLVLFLYPLLKINQGIDVSDTTYSLSNFQYFGQMNGTWIVATFLANVWGSLLMHLPFGNTLLGMNFYTGLIPALIALTAYLVLRGKMPAMLLAAGEFAALGLCWCPSVILYNYLTYLLLTAGSLLLYLGILEDKEKNRRWNFAAAGVCLGANVAVRMPNVVQVALILVVWYGVWLTDRKSNSAVYSSTKVNSSGIYFFGKIVRSIIWCLDGYLIGFGIPLVVIGIRYGWQAYPAMIQTMFAMTEKAADYKPLSMLTGMFGDYGRGLFWLLFAGICMLGGWILFRMAGRLAGDGKGSRISRGTCLVIYVSIFLLLLRFYWGRGMFTLEYYDYRSMYYPVVLLLLLCILAAVYCLAGRRVSQEQRVFALLVILLIFITPLGSNNHLYPIMNNLFLAVPFFLWVIYDWFRASAGSLRSLTWKVPLVILLVFVLVQSIGFHGCFVFQDGVWGEKRDTQIETPAKAAGVYTNQDNGELLEELAIYVQTAGLSGRQIICYGEIPGLGYLLDMPPALSTFWPDLDSYRMVEFDRDMEQVERRIEEGEERPVIILATPAAAYLSEDAEAMNWFGVDQEKMRGDEKLARLGAFMRKYGYAESFSNAGYVVYESRRN